MKKYTKKYKNKPTELEISETIKEAEAFYNGKYIKHFIDEGVHENNRTYLIDVRIK